MGSVGRKGNQIHSFAGICPVRPESSTALTGTHLNYPTLFSQQSQAALSWKTFPGLCALNTRPYTCHTPF